MGTFERQQVGLGLRRIASVGLTLKGPEAGAACLGLALSVLLLC